MESDLRNKLFTVTRWDQTMALRDPYQLESVVMKILLILDAVDTILQCAYGNEMDVLKAKRIISTFFLKTL